jgi:hypothetical protein
MERTEGVPKRPSKDKTGTSITNNFTKKHEQHNATSNKTMTLCKQQHTMRKRQIRICELRA